MRQLTVQIEGKTIGSHDVAEDYPLAKCYATVVGTYKKEITEKFGNVLCIGYPSEFSTGIAGRIVCAKYKEKGPRPKAKEYIYIVTREKSLNGEES